MQAEELLPWPKWTPAAVFEDTPTDERDQHGNVDATMQPLHERVHGLSIAGFGPASQPCRRRSFQSGKRDHGWLTLNLPSTKILSLMSA